MIRDLVLKNRSYRRFDQNASIASTTLLELLELARFSGSAANLQMIKYRLVNTSKENELVFQNLGWAGYLPDWKGPNDGEKPTAYMILLTEDAKGKHVQCDAGLAMQSMLLGAVERGLGGCIFASVKRDQLMKDLKIPEQYRIVYVLALGKPVEEVVIDDMEKGNLRYWRDEQQVHHVPKKLIEDLML